LLPFPRGRDTSTSTAPKRRVVARIEHGSPKAL